MSKPRLLIPLSIQFSVRYLLRTGLLKQISEFASPIVLLAWDDKDLTTELEAAGAEVRRLAPGQRGTRYERARSYMNLWHRSLLKSANHPIWERRADLQRSFSARIRRRLRLALVKGGMAMPGASRRLADLESRLFWEETNARSVAEWVDSLKPDAVFSLTPFLADEETLVRVCARRGIPMIASILSFDNILARGWIAATFDRYLVWNRHNASHLRRAYPHVPEDAIGIVGSPQFDFYWNKQYRWEENQWRQRLSLPQDCPVILFGGGHYFCAPHEPNFLVQLDRAIENNELPRDSVILFRCHPVDPIERWLPALKETKHVVRDDPWKLTGISGQVNVREQDIRKLTSTLYYSQVHINVASTMAVDGAIVDRPQVGPAYDDTPGRKFDRIARELYLQEHYLPITNSGGLEIVNDRRAMIEAVRCALEDRSRLSEGRRRLVREICTYDDGRATERVLEEVRSFLGATLTASNYRVVKHEVISDCAKTAR